MARFIDLAKPRKIALRLQCVWISNHYWWQITLGDDISWLATVDRSLNWISPMRLVMESEVVREASGCQIYYIVCLPDQSESNDRFE